MNNKLDKLILVDDSEVTNFFNEDIVTELNLAKEVITFSRPTEALTYFEENDHQLKDCRFLVFIDIKMPELTGYELLEELEELDISCLESGYFCMLTSSNLIKDREQFGKFPYVRNFLEKPLDKEKIAMVFEQSNAFFTAEH